jgi:hypothetical protein
VEGAAVVKASGPGLASAEVRDAFASYLDEVRGLEPLRYDEVEPWAWARLQSRVNGRRLGPKKKKKREVAA